MLFEAGVCTVLTDLIRGRQLGLPASGNGRRQSYAEVPIPRMTNTYVLAGDDDPSEIIRQTRGACTPSRSAAARSTRSPASSCSGWSRALIEGGEVTTPVRGANLVGDGPGVVASVDALGNDFTVKEGICGKEGQGVPVGNAPRPCASPR